MTKIENLNATYINSIYEDVPSLEITAEGLYCSNGKIIVLFPIQCKNIDFNSNATNQESYWN